MKNTLSDHVMPTIDQNETGCSFLRSDHGPAAPTKMQRTPINAKTEARKMSLALQTIGSGMWDFKEKLSIKKTAEKPTHRRFRGNVHITDGPGDSIVEKRSKEVRCHWALPVQSPGQ